MKRNARKVQHLQNVRIAHLVLERDSEKIKLFNGRLRLKREQRNLLLPHNLIEIHPRRINPLTVRVRATVKHII